MIIMTSQEVKIIKIIHIVLESHLLSAEFQNIVKMIQQNYLMTTGV